ncbi:MAG: LytTR family transcriptional regulator DNA-binding domain-containing protein [Bacteroidales bacterium]|jgi:DNA-binding LytR/AlgR family response regulator|nr:LytTR family transcriptional regulator [Bacteroidales bacterium]MDD2204764.1 LytTR family transcriptional regulator DNA-binding domain-containing protein [Bacteroidales bacterium]MDD3151630.1 LytTR family transcriptional regulator DNA-binding domain-containing protein [Bacteroidales bacterium]MDD3914187.1 LytTR family transcriptional regulator DNA-binding domain-containing protein [Bacteroidales bacterium]MDD4633722.1 LytTR family transcriptional regulator DNA-binding domain-containing prote
MKATRKILPTFFTEKHNIVKLIVFTAIFALCFVNIYNPFSAINWYDVSRIKFFLYSGILILTGILVITISRIIMYHYARKHQMFVVQFALWIVAEIFVLSIFYTVYTIIARHISWTDYMSIGTILIKAGIHTMLVMLFPYTLTSLYFALQDKKHKLHKIQEEGAIEEIDNSVLVFRDEKGEFRISVTSENLLYIESADNYVIIKYLNKGKVTDFMLRSSLKNLSKQLVTTTIKRCSRSCMVNFEHVKVLRKDKDGIFLELDIADIPDIAVTRTYANEITEAFLKISKKA